ncbi:unnamed protein product, partial [Prorocentrum cordatum]
MAGGVPRAKGAVRQDWTCKSCVSKRGRTVVNWGTALNCQGCRLPKATCFGANVSLPAAAKSKSKSGAAPGRRQRQGPSLGWAAAVGAEAADLKKQLKASGPASAGGPLGGAQAMEVGVGEGAGAGDAAVLAEIHMCESGLHTIKDQTADWATPTRGELRARLEKGKARLFASKPLHARTHDIANNAKQCAERLEKERCAMAQSGKGSPSLRPRQQCLEAAAAQPSCRTGSLGRSRWSSSSSGCGSMAWNVKAARSQPCAPAALRWPAEASSLARILLILSTWFGAMARGIIFAANVTAGAGSLALCVEGICERAEALVLLVQGHRARDHDTLAALQQAGTSGGVAVPARSRIIVTSPLFLESPVLLAARLVAARVNWGMAGGFVAISPNFHDSAGWKADNQHVAAVLMKYLAKLSAAGINWVVGGDFNVEPEKFPARQLHGVRGLWAAAEDATCRSRAGAWSALDYFLSQPSLPRGLAGRGSTSTARRTGDARAGPSDAGTGGEGPAADRPCTAVSCSRGAEGWRGPLAKVRAAVSREHLPEAWGDVVATVEQELLDRYDVVGHDRTECVSRRAGHLVGVGACVAKAVRQLRGASPLCSLFEAQFDKLAGPLLEAAAYLDKIIRMLVFAQAGFAGQSSRLVQCANGQYAAALAAQQKEWVKWADGSLSHGAGRAHRCSKVRDLQEVVTAWHSQQQDASPRLVCDLEMQPRAKVRRRHGLPQARRPADIEEWDAPPELTVDKMKKAALSFPTGTEMGLAKRGMRALSFLSEDGIYVCARLLMRMEKLGAWPEGRLWHAMRRLPKPSGGRRLIAITHYLVRWRSRARADISKGWLAQHPSVDIWGLGAGRSSSDAALDLNLETEVAVALEGQVAAVPLDAWNFFETVILEDLIKEARLLKMPLPLAWLVVELHRQPWRLQAFGSVSYEVVSYQGVLAGPLVDDVALQWARTAGSNAGVLWAAVTRFREEAKKLGIIAQPAKSGYVPSSTGLAAECRNHAGSRGLQLLHWARDLGHDLGGGRIQRRQTKLRLKALARRRGRLAALKRAAGRQVTLLRRAGLLPSAGHGAGVAGPSGATIYLATQRGARFDPVYEATAALVVRYSSRASITQRLVEKPTRGPAGGPIASTTLTLWRIGWHMRSSLALVTDEEQHINLLATSPSDLKAYLVEGVSRWQGRQILGHFGGAQPTGPIWMRAP